MEEKGLRVRENITFLILSISVVVFSSLLFRTLWLQTMEQKEFEDLSWKIEQIRRENSSRQGKEPLAGISSNQESWKIQRIILPEYEELARCNPDLAGWIRIEGTGIDYPVMQTIDEREYYLHRNFNEEKSFAGVPFVGTGDLTAENEDVFIYGHNMKNKTMFAGLLNYQELEFWKGHPIIDLDTLWEHRKYKIFAVFYTTEDEWCNADGLFYPAVLKTIEEREQYLKQIKEESLYETGITPDAETIIVFLVTCSYQRNDGRFVVAGVKI